MTTTTNITVSTPDGFSGILLTDGTIITVQEQVNKDSEKALTNPDDIYKITVDSNYEPTHCTCKEFELTKKVPKTCKHIARLLDF